MKLRYFEKVIKKIGAVFLKVWTLHRNVKTLRKIALNFIDHLRKPEL